MRSNGDAVDERVDVLPDDLPRVEPVLLEVAVVAIDPDRYRIRSLVDASHGTRQRSPHAEALCVPVTIRPS